MRWSSAAATWSKWPDVTSCHTTRYIQNAGKVPEKGWLMGDTTGWRGPWGTTYAVNLRIDMQPLRESQWLQKSATLGDTSSDAVVWLA